MHPVVMCMFSDPRMALWARSAKLTPGENLDAEIGSDASNLNRGTVLGLGCDGGTKRGGSFFGGHGKDLL